MEVQASLKLKLTGIAPLDFRGPSNIGHNCCRRMFFALRNAKQDGCPDHLTQVSLRQRHDSLFLASIRYPELSLTNSTPV